MKQVKFNEVKPYKAPLHFDCSTLKLHGTEETGAKEFWMGVTHFLPGGGAEYAYEDSPTEKIYVVLDGQVTIKTKTEEYVLNKYDSIFIAPNEGRSIINETNMPATMLVVVNY
ncbi:Cupin domain protein [compost metagenome]|uniref:Cupin domain protein n=1 Tax=Clostridium intestinale DSM 6191 TaxID=1121320 RepID=A0A1M6CES6_9CLOT|nr:MULTISPECIES: cupin domain-containing protein [Clostridium]WRY51390.1 cupin domain-containing protein [Clostridium intestinale]SHI59423.1 Cupin domain protein [Clostridium intestinale DSM 6191]